MEIVIKEQTKKKITFKLKGESHTLCNALKEELRNNSKVVVASYYISHPDIDEPTFTIETKGIEPKKALMDAVKKLKKQNDEFLKAFLKETK